jgi:hypothetical protein
MNYTKSDSKGSSVKATHLVERYTLTLAMLIVRQIETLPTRQAVFTEIKEKNKIIGIADRVYSMSGPFIIRRLIILLYMLKCMVALNVKTSPSASACSIANFANEVHTIKRVTTLIPEVEISMLSMARKNIFARGQIREIARMILTIPRIWHILGTIAKSHSFMPACRISSVLAYHFRFDRLIDKTPSLRAVIIASNYSPEAVALAAVAHSRNLKVIYVNHAPVPRKSPYVSPVLADCSVFYGEAIRDTYEQRNRCETDAVFIGQPGNSIEMILPEEPRSIGIFLTALTRKDTIEKLVKQIRAHKPDTHILIRHHPVALLETDLSDLVENNDNLNVTLGTPLSQDIATCDVVICGNSGVTLNALGGGRPVAYLAELDDLPFDYNGFIANNLVPHIPKWDETTYASLRMFFDAPTWPAVMTSYDASYGHDVKVLDKIARDRLLSHLDHQP